MNNLVKIKAPILWVSGYYDGPLSGVCLVDEEVVWFSMIKDSEPTNEVDEEGDTIWTLRRLGLYRMTDNEFREIITSHLLFEMYVGTHNCNHSPGFVKDRSFHHNFYNIERDRSRPEDREPFAELER